MDLCYPVDATKKPRGLKYSIRTVDCNLEFDDLYIIGKKPNWLRAKELRKWDTHLNPIKNVLDKLEVVVDSDVSEDFIWMNDDIYLMREYKEIPYYHRGKIKEKEGGEYWDWRLENLKEQFPGGYFFEPHFPIVFNKQKVSELIEEFGKEKISQAAHRSYYCNYHGIKGERVEDYKFYNKKELTTDVPFFSTTDEAEKSDAFKSLFQNFPKSRYEKN